MQPRGEIARAREEEPTGAVPREARDVARVPGARRRGNPPRAEGGGGGGGAAFSGGGRAFSGCSPSSPGSLDPSVSVERVLSNPGPALPGSAADDAFGFGFVFVFALDLPLTTTATAAAFSASSSTVRVVVTSFTTVVSGALDASRFTTVRVDTVRVTVILRLGDFLPPGTAGGFPDDARGVAL